MGLGSGTVSDMESHRQPRINTSANGDPLPVRNTGVCSSSQSKELQCLIDAAAELSDTHPMVHVSKGKFARRETVLAPAGGPLRMGGDGSREHGTAIQRQGNDGGPGFIWIMRQEATTS